MKRSILFLLAILLASTQVRAQDEYYFGGRGKLNPAIPTPESFFGFQIGKSLVRYDKVVEYFRLLAAKSDRATLEVFGHSWEGREQVALIITSPANLKNLENIRLEHLKVVDPAVSSVDVNSQKAIVYLGYNVHGGEIAGTDASVITAYYFVASEDPDIVKRLDEAVILIEPSQNPDGRERAANYINGFHSTPPVSDPADREHGSGPTPHRGNHFWNDLNRDWLALSQVESQNRVAYYHKWYPNLFLDYHEMGGGSTFYFEPSPPNSWSPALPLETYTQLHGYVSKYFSQALNSIGSLYFTKESFTNFSPIYGSTYPDFQGGAGTTLEVGSTAGIEIETAAGIRTFSRNLKDNFVTGIAALRAATEEKAGFLKFQKDFFKGALAQADKQADKYIVFGSKNDPSLNRIFIDHLLHHKINVYELTVAFSQGDKKFEPGSAWVVPYRQTQYYIIDAIFDERTKYPENQSFYDISAPSTAWGFGLPFVKVKAPVKEGAKVTQLPTVKGVVESRSDYAYAFEYFDYLTPKALYYLQDKGVKVRVSPREFTSKTTTGEKSFAVGTIVIPVHYQTVTPDELYKLLNEAVGLAGIKVSAITDGFSVKGIDLGSNNIRVLKKPVVATITGSGGNWTSVGELWQLLGNTLNIPLSKIDVQGFERVDLARYTAIVLNGSGNQFSPEFVARLTAWIDDGGTLIATGTAAQWAVNANLVSAGFAADTARRGRGGATGVAAQRGGRGGGFGERLNGVILPAVLTLNHPLTYGFSAKETYTLKNSVAGLPRIGTVVLETSSGDPVNGLVPDALRPRLKNVPVVAATSHGRGSIVLFGESPTFRGYWLTPGRILTNAIFFGGGGNGGGRY
ncbi:MAG: hypothetical protein LBS09_04295 [Bacteroidales bacterium]|jgi:hypothetical protein|nr:hypothetical protein [Bacteroidales bacterium]